MRIGRLPIRVRVVDDSGIATRLTNRIYDARRRAMHAGQRQPVGDHRLLDDVIRTGGCAMQPDINTVDNFWSLIGCGARGGPGEQAVHRLRQ